MGTRVSRWAGGVAVVVLLGIGVAAVVATSQDPDHLAQRGQEALDRHDLSRAEALFRQAAAADPAHLPALEGLGWTYLLAGQQGAAGAAFDRCAEIDPARAECLRGQASVAMAKGEVARARALLLDALSKAPDDARVQSSLGLLELSAGDVEAGAARYEALVARFPEDAEYRVGLVEARLRQKRLDEALAQVDEALALDGSPVRTEALLHLLRARVLVAQVAGRVDPARCAETAPPLLAWLDAAQASVQAAEATGVRLPTLGDVKRMVGRSRGTIEDACPAGPALTAGDPPP